METSNEIVEVTYMYNRVIKCWAWIYIVQRAIEEILNDILNSKKVFSIKQILGCTKIFSIFKQHIVTNKHHKHCSEWKWPAIQYILTLYYEVLQWLEWNFLFHNLDIVHRSQFFIKFLKDTVLSFDWSIIVRKLSQRELTQFFQTYLPFLFDYGCDEFRPAKIFWVLLFFLCERKYSQWL